MKLRKAFLSTLILSSTVLSACGVQPVAPISATGFEHFQTATFQQKLVSGQLVYASEMRGFSSVQNPMRTMIAEYTTSDGQKWNMHADRFLKYPEFNIAVRLESTSGPTQSDQYFSSKDKAKVQDLFNTLQTLNSKMAEPAHKEALGRILEHLKSARIN